MTAAATFIPKIFEEHLETVGLLWVRRRVALRSPEYTAADVLELDDLIEAHLEGLAAGGEDSLPLLDAELRGEDPLRAFAAAFALLRVGSPATLASVLDAFITAKEAKLDALRDAIAHGPSTPLAPQLIPLFLSAQPPLAAAAGEALAFHGAIKPVADLLERLIHAEEPAARAGAWRIAGYCGVAVPGEWYAAALRDEDAHVQAAAFETAAWNRSPGFYPYARALAAEPKPEALDAITTLAAVAPPEEYQLVGAVASNPGSGPERYRVISSFGHPYFVPFLIDEMTRPDPVAAAGAAAAFERMTGRAVESKLEKKAAADSPPPGGGDEDAPGPAFVPNPESARKHWAELAPYLAHAARIARGVDVSQGVAREAFDALDMESRYEHCLRARLFSGWQGTPLVLERYPLHF